MADYPRMTQSCEHTRMALSARMDGEEPGLPLARLDDHLASCPGCRAWQTAAEQATRIVRVQSVEVPDLTAPILAAVAADRAVAPHRQASRRRILQLSLAVSAVVQLVLALQMLFAPAVDLHTSREAASFDIALAVGFALAAWRPDRARAFVPVAFVLAGCLVLTSVFDIRGGITLFAHEATHLAALAQAGLLLALARLTPAARTGRRRPEVVAS